MKKILLGILVGFVVLSTTFAVLYKTDVISFNDKNNDKKQDIKSDDDLEKVICSQNVDIDGDKYVYTIKEMNNEVTLLIIKNSKTFFSKTYDKDGFEFDVYNYANECGGLYREFISSDSEYNYYLYKVPMMGKYIYYNVVYSELKSNKDDMKELLTIISGGNTISGIVPIEKENNWNYEDIVPYVRIENNSLYQLKVKNDEVIEIKYQFMKNSVEETLTNKQYIQVANKK